MWIWGSCKAESLESTWASGHIHQLGQETSRTRTKGLTRQRQVEGKQTQLLRGGRYGLAFRKEGLEGQREVLGATGTSRSLIVSPPLAVPSTSHAQAGTRPP